MQGMQGMDKGLIKRLSVICGAVALVVVLITLLIVFFTRDSSGEESASSGMVIPEGMRLVEDIYNGDCSRLPHSGQHL